MNLGDGYKEFIELLSLFVIVYLKFFIIKTNDPVGLCSQGICRTNIFNPVLSDSVVCVRGWWMTGLSLFCKKGLRGAQPWFLCCLRPLQRWVVATLYGQESLSISSLALYKKGVQLCFIYSFHHTGVSGQFSVNPSSPMFSAHWYIFMIKANRRHICALKVTATL